MVIDMFTRRVVGFVAENDDSFIKPDKLEPFESLEAAEKFWKARLSSPKEKFVVEVWEGLDIVDSRVLDNHHV